MLWPHGMCSLERYRSNYYLLRPSTLVAAVTPLRVAHGTEVLMAVGRKVLVVAGTEVLLAAGL